MTYIADIAGERLDAFVARVCPDLTRSAAQRLIEEGAVTRNGKNAKKNDKLNLGDEIDVIINGTGKAYFLKINVHVFGRAC